MNLKDVKEITIPDGTVKKIEDSNGNIIWGSQDAYPYRRLEYIHTSGAEYITTPFGTKSGYWRYVDFAPTDISSNDIRPLFVNDSSVSGTLSRWGFLLGTTQGFRVSCGSAWTTSGAYPVTTYFPLNTRRIVTLRTVTESSKPKIYFSVLDEENNSLISGNVTGTANGTLTSKTPYLMAGNGGSGAENFCTGNVYALIERRTNYQGEITHNYVPCQRKSDGVCGLYDTVGNSFLAMQGTSVTTQAAGPTVDEYWDLTAPS